jgi:hypothetical protein
VSSFDQAPRREKYLEGGMEAAHGGAAFAFQHDSVMSPAISVDGPSPQYPHTAPPSVGASRGSPQDAPLVAPSKTGGLFQQRLSPSSLPTPTKPDAESGSSIGEENPPPEIIWCDECAFRETAAEKKAELEC